MDQKLRKTTKQNCIYELKPDFLFGIFSSIFSIFGESHLSRWADAIWEMSKTPTKIAQYIAVFESGLETVKNASKKNQLLRQKKKIARSIMLI